MIQTLIFSVPAVLLGVLMGTMLGVSISRSKQRRVEAKNAELSLLVQQQSKQIWSQADRIHTLEIEKLQMTSWQSPEDQRLHDRLAQHDAERVRSVA
jgi:hypothetical protein